MCYPRKIKSLLLLLLRDYFTMTLWCLHERGLTVLQIICLNLYKTTDTVNVHMYITHVIIAIVMDLQNTQINVNF